MSLYNAISGYGNVAEYQISGTPFVTLSLATSPGARNKIEFPYITQWIVLKTPASSTGFISMSLDILGAQNRREIVVFTNSTDKKQIGPFNLRIKDMYIGGALNVTVIAGLTSIPRDRAPTLISNLSASLTGSAAPEYTNFFAYSGI